MAVRSIVNSTAQTLMVFETGYRSTHLKMDLIFNDVEQWWLDQMTVLIPFMPSCEKNHRKWFHQNSECNSFFPFQNNNRLDCVFISTGCARIQQSICSTFIALDGGFIIDNKSYNLVDDTRLDYCGVAIKASRYEQFLWFSSNFNSAGNCARVINWRLNHSVWRSEDAYE